VKEVVAEVAINPHTAMKAHWEIERVAAAMAEGLDDEAIEAMLRGILRSGQAARSA